MRVELGQTAVVADADLLQSLARNLGEEGAELFAQLEIRREPLIFFRRKRGHINRVAGHALEQVVAHLLGDANAHDFLRLFGRAGDVGRGDHARVAREPEVLGRLCLKDVQAGSGHVAALERPKQIAFMDELAARAVDNADARLGERKGPRVDQVVSFRGQRGVKADEVALLQNLIERRQLDVLLAGKHGGNVGVVSQHVHRKGLGQARYLDSDLAETDQSESLRAQLDAQQLLLFPRSLLEQAVGLREPAGERQNESQRVLGHADRVAAGRVHHHDAALGRRVHVHVVDTDAGASDGAQPRRAIEQLRRYLRGAPYDKRVRFADRTIE